MARMAKLQEDMTAAVAAVVAKTARKMKVIERFFTKENGRKVQVAICPKCNAVFQTLDGVSVPELPTRIYQMMAHPKHLLRDRYLAKESEICRNCWSAAATSKETGEVEVFRASLIPAVTLEHVCSVVSLIRIGDFSKEAIRDASKNLAVCPTCRRKKLKVRLGVVDVDDLSLWHFRCEGDGCHFVYDLVMNNVMLKPVSQSEYTLF
jgi:hypothetical protein